MKAAVILNSKAGSITGSGKDFKKEITNHFAEHGIKTDFLEPDEKESLISSGYDIIAVSGGDGTISSIAGLLTGTSIPMGVIPSGTLNHFAKDNNIPLVPLDAVNVILDFKVKKIDTGEVNGKIFINNSSIGLYPKMVKHRERIGGSKWISMGLAFFNIFKRMPLLQLEMKREGKIVKCKTPFVFIGNNEYQFHLFYLGKRKSLTDGKLSVYYPKKTGRFYMFWYAILALFNMLKEENSFEVLLTEEIIIFSNKKELEVALDGEVLHMAPPLIYKIKPLGLNLIVPKEQ